MAELQMKIVEGAFTEAEHHKIAKVFKLAMAQVVVKSLGENPKLNPDELIELTEAQADVSQLEEELTAEKVEVRVSILKGYPHSIGLLNGESLVLSALPENLTDLQRKVTTVMGRKQWQ